MYFIYQLTKAFSIKDLTEAKSSIRHQKQSESTFNSNDFQSVQTFINQHIPVPKSPVAENFTPSFVQQMTTDSPIWLKSLQIL